MRVPFPVRVFLSYLLIVVVGTLPTYIYMQAQFPKNWYAFKSKAAGRHAKRLASLLVQYPVNHRLAELHILSKTHNERITYINSKGKVLFDSSVKNFQKLDNHFKRKELRLLRGEKIAQEEFDPNMVGVGVAKRFSASANQQMLYVAVKMNPKNPKSDILRLAVPLESVQVLIASFIAVFRNSQATALSIALLLSLVAAVVFMRPLQRILGAAQALTRGEYHVDLSPMAKDEVGDVGRSLEQLAVKLRKRLARADTAKVLLLQLIRSVPTPLVLFGSDGQVIGMNASAKSLFEDKTDDAEETIALWSSSKDYFEKLSDSDDLGEPTKVKVPMLNSSKYVRGLLCALKHPTSPPFGALLADTTKPSSPFSLPRTQDIQVSSLSDVMAKAVLRSQNSFEGTDYELKMPSKWPSLQLADAQGRMAMAVTMFLEGTTLVPKSQNEIVMEYELTEEGIVLLLRSRIPTFVASMVRHCVEPLGGHLHREAGECQLTLPRA